MRIDSFLSVIEDLFGRRFASSDFFFFVVFLSILISFRFLSKFTACFLHCVRDAKIDEEKKTSILQFFYSRYFIQVMFHSFSSRATKKNVPCEILKRLVTVGRARRNFTFVIGLSRFRNAPISTTCYFLFDHFCCHASEFITCHGHQTLS